MYNITVYIHNGPPHLADIHTQLLEQLKCLDNRVETHEGMLNELQEFCKLKAAAEFEYSQRLDRIVKQTMSRHKTDKQRFVRTKVFSAPRTSILQPTNQPAN